MNCTRVANSITWPDPLSDDIIDTSQLLRAHRHP